MRKEPPMHSRTLVLRFPREVVDKPIIVNLVRDYHLDFNILKAQIFPRKEGMVVMELRGKLDDFEKGIRRDEQRCTQCGACTAVCLTGALHVARPQMQVEFDSERCSACELCVKTCPVRAMIVTFDKAIA